MHFSNASAGDERCFDVLFSFESEGVKLYSIYSIERVYTYAHNSIPKKNRRFNPSSEASGRMQISVLSDCVHSAAKTDTSRKKPNVVTWKRIHRMTKGGVCVDAPCRPS
jgi:hypothetical protein